MNITKAHNSLRPVDFAHIYEGKFVDRNREIKTVHFMI